MAKKGYPGLVVVPPSDRSILRRRLVRWGLLIIAVIWIISTVTVWPPTFDNTDCQAGPDGEHSGNPSEKCGPPNQSATEAAPHQEEFSLTQVSQAEGLTETPNTIPTPTPTPHVDQSATRPASSQNSKTSPSVPSGLPPDRTMAPSGNQRSPASLPTGKSAPNPDVDAQLAEQGDAFAQYRLGRFYAQRNGPQAPESVTWYRKASNGLQRLAETGNGQAMYVLGVMYAYGRGVARNTEQARHWLTQAVERKITAAQPVLASLDEDQTSDPSRR
ncbi:MAG: sel1 repeat family protein [Nitrospira sp.]